MKILFVLCTCLVTIFMMAEGHPPTKADNIKICASVHTYPDGSIASLPCAVYACQPGQQIGYRNEDLSKKYPECCGGPICANQDS